MKTPIYRNLSTDELIALEKEFVDYLVINGITADDWVKLKETEKDKAEDIITVFSDMILEGILLKVTHLERKGKNFLQTFHFQEKCATMVAVETDDVNADFADSNYPAQAVQNSVKLHTYTATKMYKKTRSMEIYEEIQRGAYITDDKLYKAICLIM